MPVRLAHLAPRRVEGNAALSRVLEQIFLALLEALRLPRSYGALAQCFRIVRHDETEIDADDASEAAAGLAGADGRVEGEGRGRDFGVVQVALRAVQVCGIAPGRAVVQIDIDAALPVAQRRLQRVACARGLGRADAKAILHDLQQGVLACMQAGVALALEQLGDFGFGEILRHRYREGDGEPRLVERRRARRKVGENAGRCVAQHQLCAAAAMQLRGACKQQLQVVVQLGHRADRRARSAHRVGLVDGNRRRNAFDRVHLRLVHAIEKLPRVRAEGLDIAPLPLGVQGVEDERGFARARNARHHQQFAGGQREVEVAQVVLARAANDDGVAGNGFGLHGGPARAERAFY